MYPLAANFANGVNLFHPDYQAPDARSHSIGLQRAINRLTAIEVRYVGTRLVDGSTTENWNEINFTSNGFLDEFRRAQQNLQSHIAAGCGQAGNPACSFAYRGAGTNPLPIYLAAFNGLGASAAGDPARAPERTGPTHSAWRNSRCGVPIPVARPRHSSRPPRSAPV